MSGDFQCAPSVHTVFFQNMARALIIFKWHQTRRYIEPGVLLKYKNSVINCEQSAWYKALI